MTTPQPEQQIEPRDELLSFAASANELAERIRRGEGADLARLVGAIVQDRKFPDEPALPKAA